MTIINQTTDFVSNGRLYVSYTTSNGYSRPVVFTIHKNALSIDILELKCEDQVQFPTRLEEIKQVALAMCIKHNKAYVDLEYGLGHVRVTKPLKDGGKSCGVLLATMTAGIVLISIGIGMALARR